VIEHVVEHRAESGPQLRRQADSRRTVPLEAAVDRLDPLLELASRAVQAGDPRELRGVGVTPVDGVPRAVQGSVRAHAAEEDPRAVAEADRTVASARRPTRVEDLEHPVDDVVHSGGALVESGVKRALACHAAPASRSLHPTVHLAIG